MDGFRAWAGAGIRRLIRLAPRTHGQKPEDAAGAWSVEARALEKLEDPPPVFVAFGPRRLVLADGLWVTAVANGVPTRQAHVGATPPTPPEVVCDGLPASPAHLFHARILCTVFTGASAKPEKLQATNRIMTFGAISCACDPVKANTDPAGSPGRATWRGNTRLVQEVSDWRGAYRVRQ